MKKTFLPILLMAAFSAHSAHALLPASALTSMKFTVYGVYTTADASCKTGWAVTSVLNSAPKEVDFSTSPVLGTGALSSSVGCVLIVLGNQFDAVIGAGTYATSTSGNPDSVCNAGTTFSKTLYKTTDPVAWPAATEQPMLDLTAAGLTAATTPSASTSIVPLYLSVNALCTGNPTVDATITGCTNPGVNAGVPPSAAKDNANGMALTAPATTGTKYKFVSDWSQSIGSKGGACGLYPPRWSFALVQ